MGLWEMGWRLGTRRAPERVSAAVLATLAPNVATLATDFAFAEAAAVTGAEPVIRMRGITKVFHSGGQEFHALRGVDLDFHPGQFVGVVGRSGSGKSTLVNMITGIDRPTAGTVAILGTLVHTLSESDMARWRALHLGIVFQFYQLLPMLSVFENVLLPMDLADRVPVGEREERALALLAQMGLQGAEHEMPAALSGGQQQAAAIARALANDPPILMADEPTGNLDSRTAESVFGLFERLADQGKAVIMVTHDQSLARRTQRVILLDDGRVVDDR
jgi:putative ABC transport system ATP-binding protein